MCYDLAGPFLSCIFSGRKAWWFTLTQPSDDCASSRELKCPIIYSNLVTTYQNKYQLEVHKCCSLKYPPSWWIVSKYLLCLKQCCFHWNLWLELILELKGRIIKCFYSSGSSPIGLYFSSYHLITRNHPLTEYLCSKTSGTTIQEGRWQSLYDLLQYWYLELLQVPQLNFSVILTFG